ncbi:helix-turn-helix domain-containing protein [Ruminococcaceae bacterium OttesenSCG-928-N02]|nr:helix-turn-helix domain-containing protein [Ruminococcaceae bacterium OttesenSCG-928-N02]
MSKNEARETFAKNLRHQIALQGSTRKQLAQSLGIPETTLSDWCNAKKYPRIEAIEALAAHFGIPRAALTEEEIPITFDDFAYAFLDETKQLTKENKEKLLEMARFFKTQQEKEENGEP